MGLKIMEENEIREYIPMLKSLRGAGDTLVTTMSFFLFGNFNEMRITDETVA